jgi:hypothetical protein
MDRETIAKTDFGIMYYYPETKIVHHILQKYEFGQPFRDFLSMGTKAIGERGACKWLSDDRSYATLTKEDMEWGRDVFAPDTIKAGWLYWAIVMPEKTVGKMAMDRIIAMYSEMGLTVQIFAEPEEGMRWLKSL